MSYSINERNFNSVKWELGDKKVQKNVHMVYEHPLFISKKKKCEKVCTKKIRLIFLSATWIRTWGPPKLKLHSKMPYTSRPRHRILILAIILVYIVNTALQANIKRSGARKRKYLHANYWLEFVVLHVVYNISSRKCAEININEVTSSTKNFY